MVEQFFRKTILNSLYAYPSRHRELDDYEQTTHFVLKGRHLAKFVTYAQQTVNRLHYGKGDQLLWRRGGEGV